MITPLQTSPISGNPPRAFSLLRGTTHKKSCHSSDPTLAILSRHGGAMSLTIDDLGQRSCDRRRTSHGAPARSHQLILAPFAPLFSHRVWRHAQLLLLDASLAPRARTVTATLGGMGMAPEQRFTNDHRGLNRATGSTCQGGRMLWGLLMTWLVPRGAKNGGWLAG
jgi:hypothetical protein